MEEERVQVLKKASHSIHKEKKEQIEDQNRDREKDGVKSRVKDEGDSNQC